MWCKNRNLYIGNDEIENKELEFYSEASATYAESFDFLK